MPEGPGWGAEDGGWLSSVLEKAAVTLAGRYMGTTRARRTRSHCGAPFEDIAGGRW